MEIRLSNLERRVFTAIFLSITFVLLFVCLLSLANSLFKLWDATDSYKSYNEAVIYESNPGADSTDPNTTTEVQAPKEKTRERSRRHANYHARIRGTWANVEDVLKSLKEQGKSLYFMAIPI